eukprot:scaffold3429_cov339-Prasinococcus_capsulatus_cf.AAC.3
MPGTGTRALYSVVVHRPLNVTIVPCTLSTAHGLLATRSHMPRSRLAFTNLRYQHIYKQRPVRIPQTPELAMLKCLNVMRTSAAMYQTGQRVTWGTWMGELALFSSPSGLLVRGISSAPPPAGDHSLGGGEYTSPL